MTKTELLSEITALARRLSPELTEDDGMMAALVIFHDWYAAHPQEVSTREIADAWNAGR